MNMFEFDIKKSESNKIKHGIEFEQAKKLWIDPNRVIIQARTLDEERYFLISKLDNSFLRGLRFR